MKLDIPQPIRDLLRKYGFDEEDEKIAKYFNINDQSEVDIDEEIEQDVVLIDIREALVRYPWIKKYAWTLIDKDKDRYAKEVYDRFMKNELDGGYFIYIKKDVKLLNPIQSCMMIQNSFTQYLYNLVIVEDDADLSIYSGCINLHNETMEGHVSVSEFIVKKNAKLVFTMIHDWDKNTLVRPRTAVMVDGGNYVSNYVLLSEVKDIQSNPVVTLLDNGKASLNSLIYGRGNSKINMGSDLILKGKGARGEIISRTISDENSELILPLKIDGGSNSRAHIECQGLILTDNSLNHSIPELVARAKDVQLTHEASVGRISEQEISYLMSRGLSEEEAKSVIIRGFLDARILGLPPELERQVEFLIEKIGKEGD
jgi:Fe-S cluster assembly scaffold protein SufB